MDDLVQWLGQQLDEDERIARAASAPEVGQEPQAAWKARRCPAGGVGGPLQAVVEGRFQLVASDKNPWNIDVAMAQVTHMAEHDPARVLREIDAKRRILDECTYWHDKLAREAVDPSPVPFPALGEVLDAVTPILRALALPYADRPGYRDDWRP